MLEIELEKTLGSTEKTCRENGLEFEFESSKFPIVATIRPDEELKNQMVMELGYKESSYVNGEIKLIFSDELTMSILNDFNIEDNLLNKIKNQVKKLHYLYLQIYFKKKMGM